ncbi:hypothetical protein BB558_003783 [Smittium angustum]|uniref:Uncharacterized protein n=1 Tax=Smittium angustum TaxID=133377 RepID=A0A2U1J558_SMIAN|nr:hypothetical protein BB558_003783 [Smittium angustum]
MIFDLKAAVFVAATCLVFAEANEQAAAIQGLKIVNMGGDKKVRALSTTSKSGKSSSTHSSSATVLKKQISSKTTAKKRAAHSTKSVKRTSRTTAAKRRSASASASVKSASAKSASIKSASVNDDDSVSAINDRRKHKNSGNVSKNNALVQFSLLSFTLAAIGVSYI